MLTVTLLMTLTMLTDEGMWLINDPPREQLKQKYQFDLTDAWLEHARLASVRFNSGGSGSFISPTGLVITNHHVGADDLLKLSPPGKDYYRDGYYAASPSEELKCPDLELNVLMEIVDVTAQVNAAVTADMTPAQAFAARRAIMSTIEKKSLDETKLRSDVVTLYQGGLYHLYRYKKYTDVRLVFAPEHGIAFFGGDTDNFEYPRYNLDICIFRVYEGDTPVSPKHWLKMSRTGPVENDVVFVTGNPGTTNRGETVAKLEHRRDFSHPYNLIRLRTLEAALAQYSELGPEQRKAAAGDLHSAANSRKAITGQYEGLLSANIMQQKLDEEAKLKAEYAKQHQDDPWKTIADAEHALHGFELEYSLLERGDAFFAEPFKIARHLVRLADELSKPSAERFREYRDSNLESLKFELFSPAPLYPEFERAKLATTLMFMAERLGGKHPLVEKVLAGDSPSACAAKLIAGSKLFDVAERKKLFEGGKAAIEASNDALIKLAVMVDGEARALRKKFENLVEEPERQAFGKIASARFAAFGRNIAPDATFTLRLAFGTVKGYEVDGKKLNYHTTFKEAFDRADLLGHREPFELPKTWMSHKDKIDLNTPFCFVSTADTIGGNSGSPVLNRAGEFVGINFDRNRHGLVRNFVYTDVQARHIAVHSRAIIESLEKIYKTEKLLSELFPKE